MTTIDTLEDIEASLTEDERELYNGLTGAIGLPDDAYLYTEQVDMKKIKTLLDRNAEAQSTLRHVLYHETTEENATRILDEGFRDGWESFCDRKGVWLSDFPAGYGETTLLILLKMDFRHLREYEVIHLGCVGEEIRDDSGPAAPREWLIPSDVIKERGQVLKLAD
jgi:hypothetical protein